MRKAHRNRIAKLLLFVFLLPIVIKDLHHHEHTITCNTKYEKHFHQYEGDNCFICNFEFSVFSHTIRILQLEEIDNDNCYFNNYKSAVYKDSYYPNFLLRAPPLNN